MSYQEGYTNSGQVRPERNETAPPQALFSENEVKSRFYHDIENRFMILRKAYGIIQAKTTLDSLDLVMIVEKEWPIWKKMIALKMEEAALLEMMEQERKSRRQPAKPKPKPEKTTCNKPKTLKYYTHGNNSLLMKQRKRVMLVFRKFNEWKWIDVKTKAEDLEAFFEGEPRHCNITWTGNATVLTILLQKLLKQPYIGRQTRCSAKSLVEQQFGLTANSDKTRIDSDAEGKIYAILYILNVNNPIPERPERDGDERYDTSDATLKLLGDKLRSTKGI